MVKNGRKCELDCVILAKGRYVDFAGRATGFSTFSDPGGLLWELKIVKKARSASRGAQVQVFILSGRLRECSGSAPGALLKGKPAAEGGVGEGRGEHP